MDVFIPRRYYFLFLLAMLPLFSGCGIFSGGGVDNNMRTIPELIRHFESSGLEMASVSLVRPDIAHADDAVAINVGGQEVGIYKFNTNIHKQRERLESIRKNGYVYLVGIRYNCMINGSFMMIGAEESSHKQALQQAFMSFR